MTSAKQTGRAELRRKGATQQPKFQHPLGTAFVIMPILGSDNPKHEHFKSIFTDYIVPAVRSHFEVVRSDEIKRTGAFMRDVVDLLAKCDLVIADISSSNPNVLYELGIRHALRRFGTIILRDQGITENSPADLHNYRQIIYKNDAPGLRTLLRELEEFVEEVARGDSKLSDNPVYDYLEVAFHARASGIAFGRGDARHVDEVRDVAKLDPLERLRIAKEEAEQGLHPPRLIEEAGNAVREGDTVKFFDCLEQFAQVEILRPTEKEYIDMYHLARRLDARRAATDAIWELANSEFPESRRLSELRMSHLAHSSVPSDWDRAIQLGEKIIGVDLRSSDVDVSRLIEDANKGFLGILLDAFDRKKEQAVPLSITRKLLERYPKSTHSWRNYARALEGSLRAGQDEQYMMAYRNSLYCEDVDDTSAKWFANVMSRKDKYLEAMELRVLCCLLDLDDAMSYIGLATEVASFIQPTNQFRTKKAESILPQSFRDGLIPKMLILARDCESFGAEERYMSEILMDNFGIFDGDIEEAEAAIGDVSRKQKGKLMNELFGEIGSQLTSNVGTGDLVEIPVS